MAQHYKDLIAWQKAMDLVEAIYTITEQFRKREIYSLTDQMRRAAVSIPSNIAEGQCLYRKREFTHFLRHSRGSLAELETQVRIALRLHTCRRIRLMVFSNEPMNWAGSSVV